MNPVLLEELANGGWEPVDIIKGIQNRYSEDIVFAKLLDKPKGYKNFKVTQDGLIFLKQKNQAKVLCIPSVLIGSRSTQEILISEAHSLLAHLGPKKTLTYLCDHFWWKDMSRDVHAFCE